QDLQEPAFSSVVGVNTLRYFGERTTRIWKPQFESLRQYAALRLVRRHIMRDVRHESAVVQSETARRGGESWRGRGDRSVAAHTGARAWQDRLRRIAKSQQSETIGSA